MEIVPAIIPKDFEDLRKKLSLVRGLVSCVQIDITDGIFVLSKSWPLSDSVWESGVHLDLPFCDEFEIEFDLMVSGLENNIQDWLQTCANRIVVHAESTNNLEEVISRMKESVKVGIAFNIDTQIELYEHLIERVDFVQFMGIEKIGFQGEPFSPKVIDKIKEFRARYKDVIISVDGGVNLENAPLLIQAGANRLVSGSTILESNNIEETIEKFKKL